MTRRLSGKENRYCGRSIISAWRATVLCCLMVSMNSAAHGHPHPAPQERAVKTGGTNSASAVPDARPLVRAPAACVRKLTMPPLPNPTAGVDSQVRRASHTQTNSLINTPADHVAGDPNATFQAQNSPQISATPDEGGFHLPLESSEPTGDIQLEQEGELLSLSFREAALREVLSVLAESQGLNIICSSGADIKITGSFDSITFYDALETVLSVSGHTWTRRNNVIIVTPLGGTTKLAPDAKCACSR